MESSLTCDRIKAGNKEGLRAAFMNWLADLLTGDTPAHTLLVLCLVSLIGLAIGSVHVKGIGLGIAGVLFAGLGFGHFGITINHQVLEFLREFGLILFVYSVGTQVGRVFLHR
jgi:putative transport protein